MAKDNKNKAVVTESKANGALVFEEMDAGFEIPNRTRSGAFDETLEALKQTKKVVCIFKCGADAHPANTKRKSLVKSAETKGMDIRASVRNIEGTNCLFAQYIGPLKAAAKE